MNLGVAGMSGTAGVTGRGSAAHVVAAGAAGIMEVGGVTGVVGISEQNTHAHLVVAVEDERSCGRAGLWLYVSEWVGIVILCCRLGSFWRVA